MNLSFRHSVLAAAVTAVLALGTVAQVQAQSAHERSEQRKAEREAGKQGKQEKAVEQYPNATRKAPDAKASAKASPKLQKMVELYNDDKAAEARALADEVIANQSFNAYDHAFAAQLGAQMAYEADDMSGAMTYIDKALAFDGLDNNGHYGALLMKAQLQLQEEKYADSLATMDKFLNETGSTNPEHLVLKGNALYRLERYPQAVTVLKQALAANPTGATLTNTQQLLMASYADSNQPGEASKLAEEIAAKAPADKRSQLNLANVYLQSDQYDKAAAVLEKLRASGQLTEERDYRLLYSTYTQLDNKEKQVIDVINEGLQKGVLKPDFQSYVALAQSYYYAEQPAQAIDAYRKAAPLDDDGETYLNLAKLLWQEGRIPEAKDAAKQAQAKGLKRPEEAKKILALPAK